MCDNNQILSLFYYFYYRVINQLTDYLLRFSKMFCSNWAFGHILNFGEIQTVVTKSLIIIIIILIIN